MSSDAASLFALPFESRAEETIIRLNAVKRWHMIDTTRSQTLGEHSATVSLLVYYVARTAPRGFFGDPYRAATAALVHDLSEVFTGDIPSHTKKMLSGLEELEAEALLPVFDIEVSPELRLLIKLCDLMEGIWFITRHGVDMTAQHAKHGLLKQMESRVAEASATWPDDVFTYWLGCYSRYIGTA